MIEADTPPMSERSTDQVRRLALPLAAMAITLALPACGDASAGDTGPAEASDHAAAPSDAGSSAFKPLDLARQTATMGGVAMRVGRVMARCDLATASLHGSRAAAANAAELCGDESGMLDNIKAPARYDEAITECANAYGAQVSVLRQLAMGRGGGDADADMHRQLGFCVTDLRRASSS